MSTVTPGKTSRNLSASSYNLNNGKVVETSLKKQYIFREQAAERWKLVKFSIPEVKPGSVVEYKYQIVSEYISMIPDINIQRSIPVAQCKINVTIPEYFKFSFRTMGYVKINVARSRKSSTLHMGQEYEPLQYSEDVYMCAAREVPALKNEPMMWCMDDFRSKISFELSSIDFPGSLPKSFTNTWADVNKTLKDHSDFSRGLKISNPFKPEVEHIVSSTDDLMERMRAIHQLVMSRISWDENFRLFPGAFRQVLKEGNGNSADINFILMSALRDAGFFPIPILLNPRHYGRIPYTSPSLDMVNAFVVGVAFGDRMIVLDGTNKYSDINVLPTPLLVDRARLFGRDNDSAWIDLTSLTTNMTSSSMSGSIDDNGVLQGQIITRFRGQPSMAIKEKYAKTTQDTYIENMEDVSDIAVDNYSISGMDTTLVNEKYSYEKQLAVAGDRIYINATVLPFMSRSIFTQQERMLPVEYNYPENYTISCSIKLPEGYVVEEKPDNISITALDKSLSLTYLAEAVHSTINVRLVYNMSQIIFPADVYADLKTFMDRAVAQSNSQIVLKKVGSTQD